MKRGVVGVIGLRAVGAVQQIAVGLNMGIAGDIGLLQRVAYQVLQLLAAEARHLAAVDEVFRRLLDIQQLRIGEVASQQQQATIAISA